MCPSTIIGVIDNRWLVARTMKVLLVMVLLPWYTLTTTCTGKTFPPMASMPIGKVAFLVCLFSHTNLNLCMQGL